MENLAAKLCSLLTENANTAEQWKLLGQEKDGSILVGWVQESKKNDVCTSCSIIARYDQLNNKLQILHRFLEVLNIVQATVNQSQTLIGYVTKEKNQNSEITDSHKKYCPNDNNAAYEVEFYRAFIVELLSSGTKVHNLDIEKSKQVRLQFLYREKEQLGVDKFLMLIHHECILTYTVEFDTTVNDFRPVKELKSEVLVKTFIWAQWDMINQVLYHIHHRQIPASLVSEDENNSKSSRPTLSGLQFHDDLPHETVLNIPLNLPQLLTSSNCGTYEDDVIPLRVHDCSLDLIMVSDTKGMVCVCHHYLYRPVQPPQHVLNSLNDSNTVHFAYSVTLLHHSCVIHCVIPGIPWSRAKIMRPTFAIYENHHMAVFVPGLFLHFLEIGLNHEPCCHILCGPPPSVPSRASYLVPLFDLDNAGKGTRRNSHHNNADKTNYLDSSNSLPSSSSSVLTIDLPTLDLVQLTIPTDLLVEVFRKETSVETRLGILHYFLCHKNDMEIVAELISVLVEKPRSLDIVRFMQEFLIGSSYALVQKNLLTDTIPLLSLLPVTTIGDYQTFDIKVNDLSVTLSHEKLWNTSVMLLSPQQRLVPYRSDLWTRLWDQLSKNGGDKQRFNPSRIAEKLLVSLACYQPEALSRCNTPMSPSGGFVAVPLGDLMVNRGIKLDSNLPFNETESCTASKQEHIVSVNLRELSMYLLKNGTHTSTMLTRGSCTALHVHAMATRHVAAQLEASRTLCQILCRAAGVDPRIEQERGFSLIDKLDKARRWLLFILLQRYRYSIESIAYPAPQGFASFFTYLGYRTLDYSMFLQYIQRSVFELQVDVGKAILADMSDAKKDVIQKLGLLSLMPRSRAKRLLNQWLHPVSLMLRAREHAANILCGEESQSRVGSRPLQHRNHHNSLAAFPSEDRLSPLDTFLDLLTAKASLTELDFGLLIEATVTSTEDFL
ncbi:protein pigeon [Harpegnathos saltator]|uniref:Protein pigeon n=1 Tax=Harpegnathos saltator TaxID=610380 RepID=E2B8A2_HARSA|nr:protein pigeon [Harpegnathos saltator]EFN88104.1 Protein pigeon [Harpegnathos saltator]